MLSERQVSDCIELWKGYFYDVNTFQGGLGVRHEVVHDVGNDMGKAVGWESRVLLRGRDSQ